VHQLIDLALRIVQVSDETNPAHALLRAGRREPLLNPGEAEDALLRLEELGVEVDLLVRAAGDAVAQTFAALMIDQHHAVLVPLEDRLPGAGRQAPGVGTMVTDPREIEIV
jgi:hypothetical protein